MKKLLPVFGALDALQLLLIVVIGHFLAPWARAFDEPRVLLINLGRVAFLASLAATAWGLVRGRRWVWPVCIAQFGLRVWIGAYSVAWLDIIVERAHLPALLPVVFWFAVGFDLFRLVATWRALAKG